LKKYSYLARGAVDGLLSCGGGVNGGHETLSDLKVIVDDLGEGGEAVGGAGSVGDHLHAWVVCFKVHSYDKHGGVGRRSGDDHLLGATFQVSLSEKKLTELESGVLKHNVVVKHYSYKKVNTFSINYY
jgi:hypothetical protein